MRPKKAKVKRAGEALSRLMQSLIIGYQRAISPRLPACCRYRPSCSAYALEAVRVHGPFKGLLLAIWRVLRCNPFSRGGVDPVPPKRMQYPRERGGAE